MPFFSKREPRVPTTRNGAPPITTGIARAHSGVSVSYTAAQVAKAYNAPMAQYDGTGQTVGIVELGGGYIASDMVAAKLPDHVTVVSVDGGRSQDDGPNGATGEVMLDVEVVAGVAPAANIRVYFADNTDSGFIDATKQAAAECDAVSISWGGPESQWSSSSIQRFASVINTARTAGVPVFVASGDTGSRDSTRSDVTDYPASDPNAIGCGGTRLLLNPDGTRASEVTWDDDDRQSATGGGVSKVFPGRQVPDIAGNASPSTGYEIVIDGDTYVIGGTSAVAPLYAACYALLKQAYGKAFDFVNTVQTNPTVCYDVTVGDNGSFKAGPGRDMTTGFGVVDFGKMLTVLLSGAQVPAPGGGDGGTTAPPSGGGTTTPPNTELPGCTALLRSIGEQITKFLGS